MNDRFVLPSFDGPHQRLSSGFLANMAGNRQLIQVVPRLLPARCGVSDHAIALATEIGTICGIDCAFVVLNSDERCDLPYSITHCAPPQLLKACVALSGNQPAAILVHLSGYGYSADGAPSLLAEALEEVKVCGRFPICGSISVTMKGAVEDRELPSTHSTKAVTERQRSCPD